MDYNDRPKIKTVLKIIFIPDQLIEPELPMPPSFSVYIRDLPLPPSFSVDIRFFKTNWNVYKTCFF